MFVASSVLWVSILIAVSLTMIGIGCTIAELQGRLQIRHAVRGLGERLKYEVVELPSPLQVLEAVPASISRYRKMKSSLDQYTCPRCGCPAVCSGEPQSLDPEAKHAPQVYHYHCLSGHIYLLRFTYDPIWNNYKRKDPYAYVLVQSQW